MQIQSNYNSYSDTDYGHKHNHHITKCLHEDKREHNKAASAGIKKDTFFAESTDGELKQESVYIPREVPKAAPGVKKGIAFIKGIWDLMGDEGKDGSRVFPYRIVNKWENVREKIRVSISSTLKRFGKGSGAFGALADPKGRFAGKSKTDKGLEKSKEKGTRQEENLIPAAYLSDSHLMDSYSKTGAYCRLNENLTYQKDPAMSKPDNGH